MELTKEKAIELHRKLWNYIADESEKQGRIISKKEAFEHFGWKYVRNWCWCCRYTENKTWKINPEIVIYGSLLCSSYCPLIWPQDAFKCLSVDSPFVKWSKIENLSIKDWYDLQDAIKYAREIANLPERKD